MNRQLSDQDIERIVADAIAAEAAAARHEGAPPSSAIVWWRAQMRARQEAARAAERPLTVVHALAIACGAGLLFSIIGTAIAGVKGSFGWLTNLYASIAAAKPLAAIDPASAWIMVPTAMIVSVVVASIAALVIFSE